MEVQKSSEIESERDGEGSPLFIFVCERESQPNLFAIRDGRVPPQMISIELSSSQGRRRMCLLELTTVGDDASSLRLVVGASGLSLNLADNVHTISNLSEHDVLAIEPSGLHGADKELRSVGVGSSVGHGQSTGASVLEVEVLVLELLSIDGLTTSSVAASEVTTLLGRMDLKICKPHTIQLKHKH